MAISFSIAWAVFSPFAEIEELLEWQFSRIETSDLLGVFIPTSLLLAIVSTAVQKGQIPVLTSAVAACGIFLFSLTGLAVGLFLLAKIRQPSSLKRMATIGIIVPLGALLSVAWIAIPIFAFALSILYAIPAALAIIPITFGLRYMSAWVCEQNNRTNSTSSASNPET